MKTMLVPGIKWAMVNEIFGCWKTNIPIFEVYKENATL
jgi:hypothetical protein